jgi:hypothetical protein
MSIFKIVILSAILLVQYFILILPDQSRPCSMFNGCPPPRSGEWERGCVPICVSTLKSIKSLKQRFSESEKLYLTPLNEECIYSPQRCRALQIQEDLAHWLFASAFGLHLIGPCSVSGKWVSLSNGLLRSVQNTFYEE